jgi:hypothetical protein
MGAFLYRLEQEDGTPADPPTLRTAGADVAHRRHDPAGSKDASRDRHSNREAPEASRFLPPATKVLRLERERVPVHPFGEARHCGQCSPY